MLRNFGSVERIPVPFRRGQHFGADPDLQKMLFVPGIEDPLGQRAGARAGAMSVVTGVAALQSVRTGEPVEIEPLLEPAGN